MSSVSCNDTLLRPQGIIALFSEVLYKICRFHTICRFHPFTHDSVKVVKEVTKILTVTTTLHESSNGIFKNPSPPRPTYLLTQIRRTKGVSMKTFINSTYQIHKVYNKMILKCTRDKIDVKCDNFILLYIFKS